MNKRQGGTLRCGVSEIRKEAERQLRAFPREELTDQLTSGWG
jgi:hypothetical protein